MAGGNELCMLRHVGMKRLKNLRAVSQGRFMQCRSIWFKRSQTISFSGSSSSPFSASYRSSHILSKNR